VIINKQYKKTKKRDRTPRDNSEGGGGGTPEEWQYVNYPGG
jgi:hypothetical protein